MDQIFVSPIFSPIICINYSSMLFIEDIILLVNYFGSPAISFFEQVLIAFFSSLSISHLILPSRSLDTRFEASFFFSCSSSPWYTLLMCLIFYQVYFLLFSNLLIVLRATSSSCWVLLKSAYLFFIFSKLILFSSANLWISEFFVEMTISLSSSSLLILSSRIFLQFDPAN